jgi:D-alanine transaminase
MPRYAYVNGSYRSHNNSYVHIEDRGFQFADSIYEVIAYINNDFADERGHLDRLERSLNEIGMNMPVSRECLKLIIRELVRKNRLKNANVYIQVTRGQARRDFPFPLNDTLPSLIVTAWPFDFDGNKNVKNGIKVITVPDIRWQRRDIKSTALIPQVLAKQKAVENKAQEAWMIDDNGYITEGSSSNAWIYTNDGKLVTRKATSDILRGVTRTAIDSLRKKMDVELVEFSFTPEEAYKAKEAFTSSAIALITPVVNIDGHKIANGKPGPVTQKLYEEYRKYVTGNDYSKQIPWQA